jgi:hypothetical protein
VRPRVAPLALTLVALAAAVTVLVGTRVVRPLGVGWWGVALFGAGALAVSSGLRVRTCYRHEQTRAIQRWLLLGQLLVSAGAALTLVESARSALGASPSGNLVFTLLATLALGFGAVPLVLVEIALAPMRAADRFESERVEDAAATGLVLGMAAVSACLLVYLAGASGRRVDLSYFRTSEVSAATLEQAALLGNKLTIYGFFPEASPVRTEVDGYLRELERQRPEVRVHFADRLREPQLARSLGVEQDGTLVASTGASNLAIVLGTAPDEARAKLRTLDFEVRMALTQLRRPYALAGLSVGHGELNEREASLPKAQRFAVLRTLLNRLNYTLEDVRLERPVPADMRLIFMLGPTRNLSDAERENLREHLTRGGGLFLVIDPDFMGVPESSPEALQPSPDQPRGAHAEAPEAPGSNAGLALAPVVRPNAGAVADELAALVGFTVPAGTLAHPSSHLTRTNSRVDAKLLLATATAAQLAHAKDPAARVDFSVAGAGYLKERPGSGKQIAFVVRAPEGTFADLDGSLTRNDGEEVGAHAVAGISTWPSIIVTRAADGRPIRSSGQEGRAFVLLDLDAVTDGVLWDTPSNQVYLSEVLGWLAWDSAKIDSPASVSADARILHTRTEDSALFYASTLGLPALVWALGFGWRRRRSREGRT